MEAIELRFYDLIMLHFLKKELFDASKVKCRKKMTGK